jgi:hypothetical protein
VQKDCARNLPNKDNFIEVVLKKLSSINYLKNLCIKIVCIIKFMKKILFFTELSERFIYKSCVYHKSYDKKLYFRKRV